MVVVPITKRLALMVLMVKHRWPVDIVQLQRTRLYELIEFIGQWSILDVYVVILMTAMVNFPGILQVLAGPGAVSFGVAVIVTLLAALSLYPRSGWCLWAARDHILAPRKKRNKLPTDSHFRTNAQITE